MRSSSEAEKARSRRCNDEDDRQVGYLHKFSVCSVKQDHYIQSLVIVPKPVEGRQNSPSDGQCRRRPTSILSSSPGAVVDGLPK